MTDETLPISNKPKHPKKKRGGNTMNKIERPSSKNHKENIKFPNSLWLREAYRIRKAEDFLKGHLA
jgi:hypothetical protein